MINRKFSPSIIAIFGVLLFLACGQNTKKADQVTMTKFEEFKNKEKFLKDEKTQYPGIGNSVLIPALTEKINLVADDFKNLAQKGDASDKDYQDAIKAGLDRFSAIYNELDTEDREQVCSYFEELMDLVGLESSGGHLNDFMYGFNPS